MVKAISSQLSSKNDNTNFLGSSTNLETPKQPLSVKEHKVPRVKNPHKIQVCNELKRGREREREGESRDEITNEFNKLHLTPRVLQMIEGDVIWGVGDELNALV
jgi:hypothetical protein